ncbi:acyl-CoA synthetase FdrA [Proteus sp. fly-1008]|uniref:acyl-CoA synthetase FdrA n=1 Tax=Proteus sp. fly-1008 TaxID=3136672 RepID=UPI0032D9E19F
MIHAFIKKGSFQDSVSLMIISRKLSEAPEVEEISVMMGTPANKSLLDVTGFWHDMFNEATPNDICVSIKAESEDPAIIDMISTALEEALAEIASGQKGGNKLTTVRSWRTAKQKSTNANMLLISIAGEYAAELADTGLEDGCNVMLFSDNVSIADEKALKEKAAAKGLIVMGPDCGTANIAGAPLAFANIAPKGSIGIVGASGTGIQEITSQIVLQRQGISHSIGLGGRDLTEQIGGISAITAINMLAADPNTRVIAFVSKPPAPAVRQKIIAEMKRHNKPIVAQFLGTTPEKFQDDNIYFTRTLDETARIAAELARVEDIAAELPKVTSKKIIGLYAGGTLAAECAMLLSEKLNVEVDNEHKQGTMLDADGHKIIDMGDDFYTQGKPHPMIDPSTRNKFISELSNKTEAGVLLVDFVIGYGATQDPAGALIQEIKKLNEKRGEANPLITIATITGTEDDPQNRSEQQKQLKEAGIIVMDTLPEAVLLAKELIQPHPAEAHAEVSPLLNGISVINAGLRSFADDLQSSGTPVVHYQWAPVAGGNKKLAEILKKLK